MLYFSKKELSQESPIQTNRKKLANQRQIRDGSMLQRFIESTLDGGSNGVEIGLTIIPGVLTICTAVMILTFGPAGEAGQYLGVAYEV